MNSVPKYLGLLAVLLPLPLLALCDPDPDRVCPQVPIAKYCVVALNGSCATGKMGIDINWNIAPPQPNTEAVCDYTGGGYACAAWPKYGGVSYTWSKFGNVNFVTPPYGDDHATITCSPGGANRVNLTVTSPFGLSTTTTTWVYCGYLGEY